LITRGNDRQDIFHSREDFTKFLSLLAKQKERAAFYLYAYCLMTNHVHLRRERRADTEGSIMQRNGEGWLFSKIAGN
jgi:putative transposase